MMDKGDLLKASRIRNYSCQLTTLLSSPLPFFYLFVSFPVKTQKRDLMQVGSKLQVVLLPRENQDGVLKKLKDCAYGRGIEGGEKPSYIVVDRRLRNVRVKEDDILT